MIYISNINYIKKIKDKIHICWELKFLFWKWERLFIISAKDFSNQGDITIFHKNEDD